MSLELSIIIPTSSRADYLATCLNTLESTQCDFEIIVVDGASFDTTQAVLADARARLGDRLQVIREKRREGFVRAINKGFDVAQGRNVVWLSDDARPLPGSLEAACEQMEHEAPSVALLALFHRSDARWNVAFKTQRAGRAYQIGHVQGTLFGHFGLARRATVQRLDRFDERFYVRSAEADFSFKAWYAGLTVEPAWDCLIDRDDFFSSRASTRSSRGQLDEQALAEKWGLPNRSNSICGFDPSQPCTLRSIRAQLAIAA